MNILKAIWLANTKTVVKVFVIINMVAFIVGVFTGIIYNPFNIEIPTLIFDAL